MAPTSSLQRLCIRIMAPLALAAMVVPAAPAEPNDVDRATFPKAYGILSSEHLMSPQDMSNWPVRIDASHQLFVDDYLIASMKGLKRAWHQPVKHAENPILKPDQPWESSLLCVGTVWHDPATKAWRMWYYDGKDRVMLAESDDGVLWRKPDLGLHDFKGSTHNNIVIPNGYIIGIVPDPQDEKGGLVAMVYQDPPHAKSSGFYVHRSQDGIRWTRTSEAPSLLMSVNPRLFSTIGVGDTSLFRYDPQLGRYIVDGKLNLYLPPELMKEQGLVMELGKNRIRSRTMLESDDLVHWSSPRMILFPDDRDARDAQIYGHISFVYESMWIGVARVMHVERMGWKQVELELTWSRDGRHWSRPSRRSEFIPLGGADSWEADYSDVALNGPVRVGEELWFYYRGSRSSERDKTSEFKMAVGLARLRRDGFASLDAGAKPGTMITRPLTFEGSRLFVNADIEQGGSIRAAVLSRDARPLAHFSLDDAVSLKEGSTRAPVAWRDTPEIPASGEPRRLLFESTRARLYSFWIE